MMTKWSCINRNYLDQPRSSRAKALTGISEQKNTTGFHIFGWLAGSNWHFRTKTVLDGPSGPDGNYRFLFPSEKLNDLLLGSWVSSNPFRSGNKCSFGCQRKTLTFVRSRAFCVSRDQWSMCWIRANAWR